MSIAVLRHHDPQRQITKGRVYLGLLFWKDKRLPWLGRVEAGIVAEQLRAYVSNDKQEVKTCTGNDTGLGNLKAHSKGILPPARPHCLCLPNSSISW